VWHLTVIIVGFRVNVGLHNFPKLSQYPAELSPKRRFTIWRPSAILNLKVLNFGQKISVIVLMYYIIQNCIIIWRYVTEIGYSDSRWRSSAILDFQISKILSFTRHYSLILHVRTKFRENRDNLLSSFTTYIIQDDVFNMASVCHVAFKNLNSAQIILWESLSDSVYLISS